MGKKVTKSYFINSAISLCLMFFFGAIPAPAPITQEGMQLLGIFFGAVYGWCTVSMIWPSIVALSIMGLMAGSSVNDVWTNGWGNPNAIFVFFLMIFAQLLKYTNLDKYIAAWAVSRKFTEGRPYLFVTVYLLCSAVVGMIVGVNAAMLMFWNIQDRILEDLGYERGDKMSASLTLGVTWCSAIGGLAVPFQMAAVIYFGFFFSGTNGAINSYNYAQYLGFGVVMTLVAIFAYILFMKIFIRPDISGFKHYKAQEDVLAQCSKMTKKQKVGTWVFVALIILLLIPGFFAGSDNFIIAIINKLGNTGITGLMVAVLAILICDGEHFTSVPQLIREGVVWELIFMLAVALSLGSALTAPTTGISPFLSGIFEPILKSVGTVGYLLILIFTILILTNFINNIPVGAVFLPLQYPIIVSLGLNPWAVVGCVIFVVDYGILLPSSSPTGALLHNSSGRITRKDIFKYAIPMLIIQGLLVVLIGYPWGALMFH